MRTHHVEVGLDLCILKWTVIPNTTEYCVPPSACQDYSVTTIAELKSHFKHLSYLTVSLVWRDAIRHQKQQQKSHFECYITLRQWSPHVKAATTCFYCDQSAPACPWERTSNLNRRTTAHIQGTTIRAEYVYLEETDLSKSHSCFLLFIHRHQKQLFWCLWFIVIPKKSFRKLNWFMIFI